MVIINILKLIKRYTYEIILTKLLTKKGLHVQRQVSIPVEFEGEHFDEGFRVDLFVEGKVIIELKSVEK